MGDCSVIVPTYNEERNIAPLITRIRAAVGERLLEILIIDDESTDGTAAEASRLAAEAPLRCIVRHGERGLATAVVRGFSEAQGKYCVVMDADLSHPPEEIPALLTAMENPTVHMAIGSRFVPGARVDLHWPLHRRIISRCGRLLARPLTPVRDMVAGFFCVRREEVDPGRLSPLGYKIALELIVRHGWRRIVELPITFHERAAGASKLDLREQWLYVRHLVRLYAFVLSGRRPSGTSKP